MKFSDIWDLTLGRLFLPKRTAPGSTTNGEAWLETGTHRVKVRDDLGNVYTLLCDADYDVANGVPRLNGSAKLDASKIVGSVPTTPSAHASSHLANGSDPIPWATSILGSGTTGARPAAAATNAGYLWFNTDTGQVERSTGSVWQVRAGMLYGDTASQPAAATINTGLVYYNTDTLQFERSNGATWSALTVTALGVTEVLSGSGTYTPTATGDYLLELVAGGAGGGDDGGGNPGGGGGAGNRLKAVLSLTVAVGVSYAVGAKGNGGSGADGQDGGNTTFSTLTARGGRGGGVGSGGGAGAGGVGDPPGQDGQGSTGGHGGRNDSGTAGANAANFGAGGNGASVGGNAGDGKAGTIIITRIS